MVVTHLNSSLFAMTGYCHVERSVNIYTVILFLSPDFTKGYELRYASTWYMAHEYSTGINIWGPAQDTSGYLS